MYLDLALFCAALCVIGLPFVCLRLRDFIEKKQFERWLTKAGGR
jgi:hypothetical protein